MVKVYEYDWPCARWPLAGPPLLPVTVCGAASLLVQVTVVPTGIVRFCGLKAKLWIVTEVCVDEDEEDEDDEEEETALLEELLFMLLMLDMLEEEPFTDAANPPFQRPPPIHCQPDFGPWKVSRGTGQASSAACSAFKTAVWYCCEAFRIASEKSFRALMMAWRIAVGSVMPAAFWKALVRAWMAAFLAAVNASSAEAMAVFSAVRASVQALLTDDDELPELTELLLLLVVAAVASGPTVDVPGREEDELELLGVLLEEELDTLELELLLDDPPGADAFTADGLPAITLGVLEELELELDDGVLLEEEELLELEELIAEEVLLEEADANA